MVPHALEIVGMNLLKMNCKGGKIMKWLFAVCAAVVVISAEQALADNFRCPNGNIVSTGDSISTVALKCDPPAYKSENSGPLLFTSDDGTSHTRSVFYIEWTYTEGSTLLHYLIFYGGILKEVRSGGFVP
jgi:hypothetical protein